MPVSPTSPELETLVQRAFAPAKAAVAAHRIPGAILGMVERQGARAVHIAGSAQLVPQQRTMTRETWFDLASLTKVIFTTTRILELVASGRIDLDAPLTSVIPDFRQYDLEALERTITFRQCLGHQTHLPGVEPIYTYGGDPQTLRAFILQRAWQVGSPVYSDINFMLLGFALERLTGMKVAEMPVGQGLTFQPDRRISAATEACTWRGRVMCGEVHDENAYALGGAGHAGLFGTVDGVLGFAQSLLDGTGAAPEAIALMKTPIAGNRTHGWEIPFADWSGGDHCTPGTIGHTGFTGTGLWIDFAKGRAWTLLTNRVHPSRHSNSGIFALRREVGDLVNAG